MSNVHKIREAIAYYDKLEGHDSLSFHLRLLVEHARDSLPKTKMVQVWHIHWSSTNGKPQIDLREEPSAAEARASYLRESCGSPCVSITGPHQQEVPA